MIRDWDTNWLDPPAWNAIDDEDVIAMFAAEVNKRLAAIGMGTTTLAYLYRNTVRTTVPSDSTLVPFPLGSGPAGGNYPCIWAVMRRLIWDMRYYFVDPTQDLAGPLTTVLSLADAARQPWATGFMCVHAREISSVTDSGTDGQVAIFIASPSTGVTPLDQRENSGKLFENIAGDWQQAADATIQVDCVTERRFDEPFDYLGPWILTELHDVLEEMTITASVKNGTPVYLSGYDDGLGGGIPGILTILVDNDPFSPSTVSTEFNANLWTTSIAQTTNGADSFDYATGVSSFSFGDGLDDQEADLWAIVNPPADGHVFDPFPFSQDYHGYLGRFTPFLYPTDPPITLHPAQVERSIGALAHRGWTGSGFKFVGRTHAGCYVCADHRPPAGMSADLTAFVKVIAPEGGPDVAAVFNAFTDPLIEDQFAPLGTLSDFSTETPQGPADFGVPIGAVTGNSGYSPALPTRPAYPDTAVEGYSLADLLIIWRWNF